jgi:hypothetical protein
MRVLVVGTLPGAIERAATRLRGAGHDVIRCHEHGAPAFPCAALVEGRVCPLEAGPVDVVVTARDRPWPRPSPFEAGATCALRRHVPLVVAGAVLDPFERWAIREINGDDDLAQACEEAASAPLPRHGEVATASAREVLEQAGVNADGAAATVCHERGHLHVVLELPESARALDSNVAVRVLGSLRALDPHATGIDVSVTHPRHTGAAQAGDGSAGAGVAPIRC